MSTRIVRKTVRQGIRDLEDQIRELERRYEISTAQMLREVKSGKMRETAEIAQWMIDYSALRRLRGHLNGRTSGTRTKTT